MLIEHGMTVQGLDENLGTVAELIADEGADVFRGITLSHGLLLPKRYFVPAENIVAVVDQSVHVNLTKADLDDLPPLPSATS